MIAAFAANEHWTNQLNTHWENRKNKLNKYYAAYKYNAGKYRTGLERENRGSCHVEKKKSALCATIHLISRIMANCSKSWKIRVFRTKTRRKRKKPAEYRLFLWYTIRGSNPGHPDYESGALPTELMVHYKLVRTFKCIAYYTHFIEFVNHFFSEKVNIFRRMDMRKLSRHLRIVNQSSHFSLFAFCCERPLK